MLAKSTGAVFLCFDLYNPIDLIRIFFLSSRQLPSIPVFGVEYGY